MLVCMQSREPLKALGVLPLDARHLDGDEIEMIICASQLRES